MNILHHLWFGYFWPSDEGNGPEALQQTVVYGLLAVIFVPLVRKWFMARMAALHEKLDHAHDKIDHIIRHSPDIPEFPKKEK